MIRPASSTTSPNGFTAISAATTSPPPSSIAALPMPVLVACRAPSSLPALHPVPAPTLPWATASSDAARQAA